MFQKVLSSSFLGSCFLGSKVSDLYRTRSCGLVYQSRKDLKLNFCVVATVQSLIRIREVVKEKFTIVVRLRGLTVFDETFLDCGSGNHDVGVSFPWIATTDD